MKYKFSYLTKIVKIKIVTKIKTVTERKVIKWGRNPLLMKSPHPVPLMSDMICEMLRKGRRWGGWSDKITTRGDKEWWNWVKLCKLVKTQVKRGGGQQRCEKKRRGGGTDCFQLPPPKVHITHLPTSTTYDKQGCENCSGSRQLSWCAIQFDK